MVSKLEVLKVILLLFILHYHGAQAPPPRKSVGQCCILFSEINTDNPGLDNMQVYLELMKMCVVPRKGRPSTNELEGYKIVIVRGLDRTIVAIIDLAHLVLGSSNFIVVGSPTTPQVNIDLNTVENIFKNPEGKNLLPNGDDSAYGALLLHSLSKKTLRDLKLPRAENGDYLPQNIEEYELRILKENLVDMVVWGKKASDESTLFFDTMWPSTAVLTEGRKYLMRDIDSEDPTSRADFSLNRCTGLVEPFLPELFMYDTPSPGVQNPCKGYYFFSEDIISKISSLVPIEVNEDSNLPMETDIDTNSAQGLQRVVSVQAFASTVNAGYQEAQQSCRPSIGEIGLTSNLEMMLTNFEGRLHAIQSTSANQPRIVDPEHAPEIGSPEILNPEHPINTPDATGIQVIEASDAIDEEAIQKCALYLPFNGDVLRRADVKNWIQINEGRDGLPLSFSCSKCIQLFEKADRADIKQKDAIQTPKGYYSSRNYKNEHEILDHRYKDMHVIALKMDTELKLATTIEEYNAVLKTFNGEEDLIPTIKMVRTVYSETISEVPWNKHKYFVDLQKLNGVELGSHHFHKVAAKNIMMTISKVFHDTLLDFLVVNDKPFSLLVDGTTDSRNIPYLICYIQTVEDGYPIVYFYRVIELKEGESAEKMFDSFWAKVVEDSSPSRPFSTYFTKRIASVSSDGAHVMVGKNRSFWTFLVAQIKRQIPVVQCMAHKAALSIRRAIMKSKNPNISYFKTFEKTVNEFYNYYMSRGSKRWYHLVDLAREMGMNVHRIKYFFEVRWASSEWEVLYALKRDYLALRLDTIAIVSGDEKFTAAAKLTAQKLHEYLADKTWVIVLHESLDFLAIHKELSLNLQSEPSVLAGKADLVRKAFNSFEELKTEPGSFVKNFLKEVTCRGVCVKGTCTLSQYDDCTSLSYNDLELADNSKSGVKLSIIRTELYEGLQKELKFYFNFEELDAFEIFNQKKFKDNSICPTTTLTAPFTHDENFASDFESLSYENINQNSVYQGPLSDEPSTSADHRHGHSTATGSQNSETRQLTDNDRWTIICKFYSLSLDDCTEIKNDFSILKAQILISPRYFHNLNSEITTFWPLVSKNLDGDLRIPSTLQDFLDTMLCTPFGTSQCERGFSFLTRVKTNERSGLSPEHTDDILRIIINGSKDISNFNALKVAKEFLKSHVKVDDETFQGGRPKKTKFKYSPQSKLF